MPTKRRASARQSPRYGVARVISKLGLGSRTQAARWIDEGRVRVNGALVRDGEYPVTRGVDRVTVDGREHAPPVRLVVMLNKPRGLLTTVRDEQGRETVYSCLKGSGLPWLAPVGRLDKASEGLLLFTNDPSWASRIAGPAGGHRKTYHVQIDRLADPALLEALERGAVVDGERLGAHTARLLRSGTRNSWLEIVLVEGRNRQIRRLMSAFGTCVLRLVRVAIGPLALGDLPKGAWRVLDSAEFEDL